jgi:hypothetical protein
MACQACGVGLKHWGANIVLRLKWARAQQLCCALRSTMLNPPTEKIYLPMRVATLDLKTV